MPKIYNLLDCISPDSILYCIIDIFEGTLQRGYIILIIGSDIVISALWAESFAGPFLHENIILNGVSIRPTDLVNTTIQVAVTSSPVSLAIHLERNNNNTFNTGQGQISNNTLRENIQNPNGSVVVLVKDSTLQLKGRHC